MPSWPARVDQHGYRVADSCCNPTDAIDESSFLTCTESNRIRLHGNAPVADVDVSTTGRKIKAGIRSDGNVPVGQSII